MTFERSEHTDVDTPEAVTAKSHPNSKMNTIVSVWTCCDELRIRYREPGHRAAEHPGTPR
jgi:hypothetical protein